METRRGVEYEDGAVVRPEKRRRSGGKRTIYGDLPPQGVGVPSSGANPDIAAASPEGPDDAVVDAFWRDALDSIS